MHLSMFTHKGDCGGGGVCVCVGGGGGGAAGTSPGNRNF